MQGPEGVNMPQRCVWLDFDDARSASVFAVVRLDSCLPSIPLLFSAEGLRANTQL